MTDTFETALAGRVAAMADACTRCGKCVEVCPVTGPGGVDAEPVAVIAAIIDILRTGDGPEASRKWANACVLTGECIKACDYGVNPRFLLGMARVAMARHEDAPPRAAPCRRRRLPQGRARRQPHLAHATRRRDAGAARSEARQPAGARRAAGLRLLHRLQRAQDAAHRAARARHHGHARRHLSGDGRSEPLLRRGADAHRRRRDLRPLRREPPWTSSPRSKTGQVLSWCPSCHVQFTETTLPTVEKTRGAKPFEMTPFMLFLRQQPRPAAAVADRSASRCASRLHRHPGIKGVVEAAEDILQAVPGVELVDLQAARGRHDEQLFPRAAGLSPRAAEATSSTPPSRPASTRWSRSITPTTASCARTSATIRSGS